MNMSNNGSCKNLCFGFLAGALAVLFFHQLVIYILKINGLVPFAPYSNKPYGPLGVPTLFNQMFWGGVWGIVFAFFQHKFLKNCNMLLKGIAFGIFPALFGWVVMAYIRGNPMFAGFDVGRILIGLLINCSFGLGIAVFMCYFNKQRD